jgi:hypothetical protein
MLLTPGQEEFADWLKNCIGVFQKPSDEQTSNCEDLDTTAESKPLEGASHGRGGHSHASPCSHAKPQVSMPHPFHCYSIKGKNGRVSRQDWASWKLRKPSSYAQGIWYCSNLAQAARRYSWRLFRMAGAVTPFWQLARDLQNAMAAGNVKGTSDACKNIVKWGGLNGHRGAVAASQWIAASGSHLITDITDATNLLRPGAFGTLSKFDGTNYLMDSATTKIYAAAALDWHTGAQEVLMYDGRIGAALCLFVRHFIKACHPGCTPAQLGLDFLCGREGQRNPSQPGIKFERLSNNTAGHQARAEKTRLAARIIQRASETATASWQFAEFEKALFMTGYNVRDLCCGCSRP